MASYCRELADDQSTARDNTVEVLGLNEMSDWSTDEIQSVLMRKMDIEYMKDQQEKLPELTDEIIEEKLKEGRSNKKHPAVMSGYGKQSRFDWRDYSGYLSPVRDQGHCGSCWAFATTGLLEVKYAQLNEGEIKFSEQQILDCVTKDVSWTYRS